MPPMLLLLLGTAFCAASLPAPEMNGTTAQVADSAHKRFLADTVKDTTSLLAAAPPAPKVNLVTTRKVLTFTLGQTVATDDMGIVTGTTPASADDFDVAARNEFKAKLAAALGDTPAMLPRLTITEVAQMGPSVKVIVEMKDEKGYPDFSPLLGPKDDTAKLLGVKLASPPTIATKVIKEPPKACGPGCKLPNGRCVDGVCYCKSGFGGADCSVEVCKGGGDAKGGAGGSTGKKPMCAIETTSPQMCALHCVRSCLKLCQKQISELYKDQGLKALKGNKKRDFEQKPLGVGGPHGNIPDYSPSSNVSSVVTPANGQNGNRRCYIGCNKECYPRCLSKTVETEKSLRGEAWAL